MRYDSRVTFIAVPQERYNPETGSYDAAPEIQKEFYAKVSNLGIEKATRIFGDVKTHKICIFINAPVGFDWDYVIWKGKKYQLVFEREYRSGSHSFFAEELCNE